MPVVKEATWGHGGKYSYTVTCLQVQEHTARLLATLLRSSSAAWLLPTFPGSGQDSPGACLGWPSWRFQGRVNPELVRQNRTAECLSERQVDCARLCRIPAWGAFRQKEEGVEMAEGARSPANATKEGTQTLGAVCAHHRNVMAGAQAHSTGPRGARDVRVCRRWMGVTVHCSLQKQPLEQTLTSVQPPALRKSSQGSQA